MPANARTQLRSLAGSLGYLRRNVARLNLSQEDQQNFLTQLTETYTKMRGEIIGAAGGTQQLMNKTLKNVDAQADAAEATGTLSGRLKAAGVRLSWFGFRLTGMGRQMINLAAGPIKGLVQMLGNMDKGLADMGMAVGLSAGGFTDGSVATKDMITTMKEFPQASLEIQGAMGQVRAAMMQLAVDNAPALISILKGVTSVVSGAGSVFITSLVNGIASAMPFITLIVNALGPLWWILGKVVAVAAILAPMLIGLGTALFFGGPIASAVEALGALSLAIVQIISGFTILITLWDTVSSIFEAIGKFLVYLGGGGGGGGVNIRNENTYFTTNEIGNISADIDMDKFNAASSRGSGGALTDRTFE